jgi:predicted permease
VAGIVVGYLLIPILIHVLPPVRDLRTAHLTTAIEIGHDARPLIIGLILAIGSFLGFGCAPAWIASRMPVRMGLQSGRVSHRLGAQHRLLLLQVALCTLLLACASLLTRSFLQLRATNPGFDAEHLVSFTFDPELRGYSDNQANRLRERLMGQVQILPGVTSVAIAQWPLMRGTGLKFLMAPRGRKMSTDSPPNVTFDAVSENYFETMGMKILEGRGLPAGHMPAKVHLAVVNQALARELFPGMNPTGQHFVYVDTPIEGEIVGVVGDSKFRSLREPPSPIIYEKASDLGRSRSVLYVRTGCRPESLIEPVQKVFAFLDPTLPVTDVATMEEELDALTAGERFNARIALAFALFAAILAGLGIYGLMALIIAQRRHELAIHVAVGASRSSLVILVSRQFVVAVAGGAFLGLGASLFASPILRGSLYGVKSNDATSLLAPLSAVAIVALLGSLLPLLHAMSIEPAVALRQTE